MDTAMDLSLIETDEYDYKFLIKNLNKILSTTNQNKLILVTKGKQRFIIMDYNIFKDICDELHYDLDAN